METVEFCQFPPGECIFGGGTGDLLVDTGRSVRHNGRVYVALQYAREIGEAAGLAPKQALDAAMEQLASADERVEALERENQALKGALEAAESVRRAMAFTLEMGVTKATKTRKIELRQTPGTKRVDINESLWKPYVEAVEGEPDAEPVAGSV